MRNWAKWINGLQNEIERDDPMGQLVNKYLLKKI